MMKILKYLFFYLLGVLTVPSVVMFFCLFFVRNPGEVLSHTFPDSKSIEAEVIIGLEKQYDAKEFRDLETDEILDRMDSLFTSEKEVLRTLMNSGIETKITFERSDDETYSTSSFWVKDGVAEKGFESSSGSVFFKYVDIDFSGLIHWFLRTGSIQPVAGGDATR